MVEFVGTTTDTPIYAKVVFVDNGSKVPYFYLFADKRTTLA